LPYRSYNLDEVSEYLHIPKKDVEQLVKSNGIPFDLKGSQPVFRKKNIDEWASQRILGMQGKSLNGYHKASSAKMHNLSQRYPLMPEFMNPQRIAPALESKTKASILRDMTDLADQTDLASEKQDLLNSLIEREKLCSTALAGGLALLHPRTHDPYIFTDSFIVLGRTIQPIFAGAPDGKPTYLFFLICCQDDRIHLHTLARICTMCQNTDIVVSLRNAADAQAMYDIVVNSEIAVIGKL